MEELNTAGISLAVCQRGAYQKRNTIITITDDIDGNKNATRRDSAKKEVGIQLKAAEVVVNVAR